VGITVVQGAPLCARHRQEGDMMAIATFAAGCFWGVEQRFARLDGVTGTQVGYTGGVTPQPTYKQVCSHRTGHAEAVRLEYDPERITYEQLLAAFFDMHDPTQLNRQGPDRGDQYRSAIFFHTTEQEDAARDAIRVLEAESRFRRPVVTAVVPAPEWWPAEDYHQKYFEKHGRFGCAI
jgi:peptide-methionine (S)-S-oxide reductase